MLSWILCLAQYTSKVCINFQNTSRIWPLLKPPSWQYWSLLPPLSPRVYFQIAGVSRTFEIQVKHFSAQNTPRTFSLHRRKTRSWKWSSYPANPFWPCRLPLPSPLTHQQPPLPHCCSLTGSGVSMASEVPAQGLYSCCSFCPECSCSVILHGSLPHFLHVFDQTAPYQWNFTSRLI